MGPTFRYMLWDEMGCWLDQSETSSDGVAIYRVV